jgi:hypothetical protein
MSWHFRIAGVEVQPFDARAVLSPCALHPSEEKNLLSFDNEPIRYECLKLVMYAVDGSTETQQTSFYGQPVLDAMAKLHGFAESDRNGTAGEGNIYDWLPLARKSMLPPRIWRDALLAVRTREKDHVHLGKGINSDGTGTPRDMVEGVLLRLFHGLECLYPTALKKESAFKFKVRPRGAAYYHLLESLERLGRGEFSSERPFANPVAVKPKTENETPEIENSKKRVRSRRGATTKAMKKIKSMASTEQQGDSNDDSDVDGYVVKEESVEDDYLPLPQITSTLWPHQEASVTKILEGIKTGKRGHADASAVGAGKTLTALASIVRSAHWIEESGGTRHGSLIMLPTKALIKEWLIEIATHTKGFHVVEQREDGTLFSLTYSKNHAPIDGNTLVISTLDRVSSHPFLRQSAWDLVGRCCC